MQTRGDRFGIEDMRRRLGAGDVSLSRIAAYYREREPDLSGATVRWRLTALRGIREISAVGRGMYRLSRSREFRPRATAAMRSVVSAVRGAVPPDVPFCIWTTAWIRRFAGRNSLPLATVVQVPREWTAIVTDRLRIAGREALVETLVAGSPRRRSGRAALPRIEKLLVDAYCLFVRDGWPEPRNGETGRAGAAAAVEAAVREAAGTYGVNRSTALRYARNRGVRMEMERLLGPATEAGAEGAGEGGPG
jgi:hypothetical protein